MRRIVLLQQSLNCVEHVVGLIRVRALHYHVAIVEVNKHQASCDDINCDKKGTNSPSFCKTMSLERQTCKWRWEQGKHSITCIHGSKSNGKQRSHEMTWKAGIIKGFSDVLRETTQQKENVALSLSFFNHGSMFSFTRKRWRKEKSIRSVSFIGGPLKLDKGYQPIITVLLFVEDDGYCILVRKWFGRVQYSTVNNWWEPEE